MNVIPGNYEIESLFSVDGIQNHYTCSSLAVSLSFSLSLSFFLSFSLSLSLSLSLPLPPLSLSLVYTVSIIRTYTLASRSASYCSLTMPHLPRVSSLYYTSSHHLFVICLCIFMRKKFNLIYQRVHAYHSRRLLYIAFSVISIFAPIRFCISCLFHFARYWTHDI